MKTLTIPFNGCFGNTLDDFISLLILLADTAYFLLNDARSKPITI